MHRYNRSPNLSTTYRPTDLPAIDSNTSSSDRIGDAALDFVDLVASGTQYTAPSSKANSELSLNRHNLSGSVSTGKMEPFFGGGGGGSSADGGGSYPSNKSYAKQTILKNSSRYSRVNNYPSPNDRMY